jgi:small-conductance mechanosensitive channel
MQEVQIQLDEFIATLPDRLIALAFQIALAAFILWIGVKITRHFERWGERFVRRAQPEDNDLLIRAVRRIISVGGVTLSIVAMLGVLGVNVGALIAGLGLTTAALAFSLKDTLEQAITGVVLLFQRPFKVGDTIEIEGVEGVVEDIAIRTTNIRTFDGLHVLIPNNRVYQGIIRNKSHYTTRRWQLTVGLAYDTDLPRAHRAILEAVQMTVGVVSDPPPTVSFEGFDAASIRAIVRYWIEPAQADAMATQTAVLNAIKEAAQTQAIGIPALIQPPKPPDRQVA